MAARQKAGMSSQTLHKACGSSLMRPVLAGMPTLLAQDLTFEYTAVASMGCACTSLGW